MVQHVAEHLAPHRRRRPAGPRSALDALSAAALRGAGVGLGTRVLDLGAGTGGLTALALGLGADEVVAVERDPRRAAEARTRLAGEPVRVLLGDVGALPLGLGGAFDVVCARFALGTTAEPADALFWAVDHLRPGGGIAVIERQDGSPDGPGDDRGQDPGGSRRAQGRRGPRWRRRGARQVDRGLALGDALPELFAAAALPRPDVARGIPAGDGTTLAAAWVRLSG